MADAEQALLTYMATQGPITAVLGTAPMRIWPLKLNAPNTLPAVTTQVITQHSIHSHSGYSNMSVFTWQLTIWATSYNSVKAVRDILHLALFGYKGILSGVRISIPNIQEPLNTWEAVTQVFQRVMSLTIHAEY